MKYNDNLLEKDLYSIYERGGVKHIHFFGYLYYDGEPADLPYRNIEYTGFEDTLANYLAWRADKHEYDRRQAECQQYISDLSKTDAEDTFMCYFGGSAPKSLPLGDVSMETPCGDYIDIAMSET